MDGLAGALIAIALWIFPSSAMGKPDALPHFDIAATCREARAFAGENKDRAYQGCMKDETDARAQLARRWAQFKAADRSDCVAQGAAPLPSYVEMLTCLEMSEQASNLDKPGGAPRPRVQGAATQGSSGQGQAAPPAGALSPLAPSPGAGNSREAE